MPAAAAVFPAGGALVEAGLGADEDGGGVSEGLSSGSESGSTGFGDGSGFGASGSGSGSTSGESGSGTSEGGAGSSGGSGSAGSGEGGSSGPTEGGGGGSGSTEGGSGSSGGSEGGSSGSGTGGGSSGSTEGGAGSSGGSEGGSETSGGSGPPAEPFRFFSPTSVWNRALPANAPLDPSSSAVAGALQEEVAHEEEVKKGPAINTTSWSVPIYTVPANQPTVKVTLPYASLASRTALQAAWEAVPLPANAQPAAGADKHLAVWQPSADKLWEFWHLEKTSAGWEAFWGGAIHDVPSATGAYGPEAWSGAAAGWGASASSLSIAGGLITLEDLEKGTINHALAIAVPNTRAGVYAAPAQRTDGASSEASSLPEGAHLRLEPGLDLASLHLPHFTLLLAEAAQRYGIVVRDTAANVALYAQDPTPTGINPYTGAHGYYEGKSPAQLLAVFPWSHLQLLKMDLHGQP
ncbi:MAG TPA: hypothetical protein VNV42_03355 [Solirubrobacteraceae bacterium]|nr:hypothetical protein [Solirubrobacteraceae bacterium]